MAKEGHINNVWHVHHLRSTCHRAVIYPWTLLHRKGWQETSLTLKQFALRDTDEMRKWRISENFINSWMFGGAAVRILSASLLCIVRLWCDKTLNKTGLLIYLFVCFLNEFILLPEFERVALMLLTSSQNLLSQNWQVLYVMQNLLAVHVFHKLRHTVVESAASTVGRQYKSSCKWFWP